MIEYIWARLKYLAGSKLLIGIRLRLYLENISQYNSTKTRFKIHLENKS